MSKNCPPSISTAEKPSKHISVEDWHRNIYDLRLNSEGQQNNAAALRNATRQNRNEAAIASLWARHNTNIQISDRVAEEQQWIHILQCAQKALDEAAYQLNEEKSLAELEIEAYCRGLAVVAECQLLRDRRADKDLTYDDPYTELQNELKLLESSKYEMTERSQQAWELINNANTLSSTIRDDLNDKISGTTIDSNTLELTPESPLIAYKPDALKIRPEIIGHESWLQRAQSLQSDADTLAASITKHSEAMRLLREKVKMSYLTQVEATNYALRKRIYHANKLKNELEWQKKNAMEEMTKVQSEIDRHRICEFEHEKSLKCAETRQEDRNMRPVGELVRDLPHDALLEEITKLRQNLRDIRGNIDNSMRTYNNLESLVNRLSMEIASKELCVQMEMRTLDARGNLLQHGPLQTINKDAVLVKMEQQLAPTPLS